MEFFFRTDRLTDLFLALEDLAVVPELLLHDERLDEQLHAALHPRPDALLLRLVVRLLTRRLVVVRRRSDHLRGDGVAQAQLLQTYYY